MQDRLGIGAAGVVLGVLSGGCVEPRYETPPFEPVYESELVTIEGFPSLTACEGSGPRADAQVRFLASTMELGLPDEPIPFFWLTEEGFEDYINCESSACAQGRTIYSTVMPHAHELTHAYMADRFGERGDQYRHAFFEEGMAEMFGTEIQRYSLPEVDPMKSVLEDTVRIEVPGRVRAAHFVRWLTDTYEWSEVMAYYEATTGESEPQVVLDAYEDVFGQRLEDAFERYDQEAALCQGAGGYERAMECEQAETQSYTGTFTRITRHLDCGDPEVFNSYGDIAYSFAIDIPDLTSPRQIHRLSADVEGAVVQLHGCAGCGNPFRYDSSRHGQLFVELEPGRYWGRLLRPAHDPGEATLSIVECFFENGC